MHEINPASIKVTRGHLLVEITEQMGGQRPSGLFVPHEADDRPGKDTAIGIVLQIGGDPVKCLRPKSRRDGRTEYEWRNVKTEKVDWPGGEPPVKEDDVVLFPRDVPKAFACGDRRFAILNHHDLIAIIEETTDPNLPPRTQGFEVTPSF